MKTSAFLNGVFRDRLLRHSRFVSVGFVALFLVAAMPLPAQEDEYVDDEEADVESFLGRFFESQERRRLKTPHEKLHRSTLAEYSPVIASARASTVNLLQEERVIALGTIVSADGFLVTKASEIEEGELMVQLPDRQKVPGEVVRVFDIYDLALVRVPVPEGGLTPIEFAPGLELPIGTYVIAAGPRESPLAIGAVSLKVRNLANSRKGFLGVQITENETGTGLIVAEVVEGSGAHAAGVRAGDIILSINEIIMETQFDLINTISQSEPGDHVILEVDREGETLEVDATLGDMESGLAGAGIPMLPQNQMMDMTARMGGGLSRNRSGYPKVLQHDLMLRPNQCGSPLVNLDGKAVGINIARAGRVRSYAIPSDVIEELLVNRHALPRQLIAWEVEDLAKALDDATANVAAAEAALVESRTRREEVEQALEEVRGRLEALDRAQIDPDKATPELPAEAEDEPEQEPEAEAEPVETPAGVEVDTER